MIAHLQRGRAVGERSKGTLVVRMPLGVRRVQRKIMIDEYLQTHSNWLGQGLRVHRMAEIASDARVVSHDALTQRLCSLSLLQSFNIQPSCGSDSPCVLRALRYGVHLGSEIPLLSGLVRPFFNSNVRDPRVRSDLGDFEVSTRY